MKQRYFQILVQWG